VRLAEARQQKGWDVKSGVEEEETWEAQFWVSGETSQ
jgi:hypothetical protein